MGMGWETSWKFPWELAWVQRKQGKFREGIPPWEGGEGLEKGRIQGELGRDLG